MIYVICSIIHVEYIFFADTNLVISFIDNHDSRGERKSADAYKFTTGRTSGI
jgi:hypothetical protein